MKKSKIYTKSGDTGETSLVDGTRVFKSDNRIDLYGDIDELNSYLGLLYASLSVGQNEQLELNAEMELIQAVQSELFSLGSNLACPKEKREKFSLPQVQEAIVMNLENCIDRLDSELPQLKNFILPGGSVTGAHCHIARVVTRRVERKAVHLNESDNGIVGQIELKLLNRLSDFLFVLSRKINLCLNYTEITWTPDKNK